MEKNDRRERFRKKFKNLKSKKLIKRIIRTIREPSNDLKIFLSEFWINPEINALTVFTWVLTFPWYLSRGWKDIRLLQGSTSKRGRNGKVESRVTARVFVAVGLLFDLRNTRVFVSVCVETCTENVHVTRGGPVSPWRRVRKTSLWRGMGIGAS